MAPAKTTLGRPAVEQIIDDGGEVDPGSRPGPGSSQDLLRTLSNAAAWRALSRILGL